MAYATALELVKQFGSKELAELATPKSFPVVHPERLELALEGTDVTGADDENALEACLDAITQALELADSIVDSMIAVRYTLPLSTVPLSLKKRTLDLARYELAVERPTIEMRQRRDDAMDWLKMLSSGKATLGDPAIDSGAANEAGIGVSDYGDQTFTNANDNSAFNGYGFK